MARAIRKRSTAAAAQQDMDMGFDGDYAEAPAVRAVAHRPWETGMNPEQSAVIAHTDGPLFCPAQAGTGKTRALVNRIARLVHDGVDPARVLAVTFSKKAADEMNKRLEDDLDITTARVGTWHSLALEVIKKDSLPQSQWNVDERNRHKFMVKEAMGYKYTDWKSGDLNAVCGWIGRCKANLWLPDSPETKDSAEEHFGLYSRSAVNTYRISDELTHGAGLLTFDDMLVFAARHLTIDENAERWAAKWDYVLQDEAQDTNVVQMTMAKSLAQYHRNYMVVGDPAQSVYGFRGSSPKHLMDFLGEWGATAVYMNRNYRSGRTIVEAANNAIRPAAVRLPVDMIAMRDFDGTCRSTSADTLDSEADQFVAWVTAHKLDGAAYGDCTCLFRTNAQSRALEEALLGAKIPYVVVGGTSFYERKEVKDVLSYLRVAAGRDPDGDAVRRCLNAPFRYLGAKFTDRAMDLARPGCQWTLVVRQAAQQSGIQRRQESSAYEWADLVECLTAGIAAAEPPATLLTNLLQRTRFIEWLEKDEGEESIEQSGGANVRELVRVAGRFATTTELLDYIERSISEAAKQRRKATGDRVLLMSVHRSKGLEWPHVWVAGCNEGILPHGKGDLDEERRLFYVAVTRGRDNVVCSYVRSMATKMGVRDVPPSRFLTDAGLLNGMVTR